MKITVKQLKNLVESTIKDVKRSLKEEILGDDECPECGCVDCVQTELNGDCYCLACECTWNSGKGDGSASHIHDAWDDGNDDLPEDYEVCGECGYDHSYEYEEAHAAHMAIK